MTEVAARPLRDVIHPRNDIVHPRDNPTGIETFVGLEHIEPQTGRRIGAVPIDLGSMTGRKARFLPGDIVYGYLRPYLNKVWIAEFAGFCSVDQYVFIVDEAIADAAYVASYLRSPAYLSAAPINETPGQLPRIRIDEVLSTSIPLPPLDEQRRIAARLRDQLDAAGSARLGIDEQSGQLRRLRSAVSETVFAELQRTHGLRPLGSLIETRNGIYKHESHYGRGVPIVKMFNIGSHDGRWILNRLDQVDLSSAESTSAGLVAGDLVLNRVNSRDLVGKTAVVDGNLVGAVFESKNIRIRVRPESLDPRYLALWLNHRGRGGAFATMARQIVGMATVNRADLNSMKLPLPEIGEQSRTAARLEEQFAEIDRAKAALNAQRAAIYAMPAALLREVFGEVSAA